jgi:hypothetical protein
LPRPKRFLYHSLYRKLHAFVCACRDGTSSWHGAAAIKAVQYNSKRCTHGLSLATSKMTNKNDAGGAKHALTRWGKSRFLCVLRIVSCIYDSHCCSCKDLLGGTPCREVLPAKKNSAERYSLSPLLLARPCQVLIVMLPHRRVGRLHDESARTVLEKGLVPAAVWQGDQSPLRAEAFTISRPVPSVGPVAPALNGETAVGVAAPCCGDDHLGTFLSGSRPVYRNTGSCFLQRATPCR